MFITRAPLRISFAGGGTDLPGYYRKHGPGAVISTAINRYVYISLSDKFDGKVSVRYRNHESVDRVEDLDHALIREILLHYGVHKNVELVVSSEVPAKGSGLGASSALAVALCLALESKCGRSISKLTLAETASYLEIEKVGSPIGKQDHYAAAFGGLNFIQFNPDDTADVIPFPESDFTCELEGQSMLFYLNIGHTYQKDGQTLPDKMFVPRILSEQTRTIDSMVKEYDLQRDNAFELRKNMDYEQIERFMDHINENWRIKKKLHRDISNPKIDDFMRRAMSAGATAAKNCGAGGGGFVYLLVPPSMQPLVEKELSSEFPQLKFSFNNTGAQVIFNDSVGVGVPV